MKTFLRFLTILILVVVVSGCAGGRFLLQGREKTLDLDQDHGVVIFTSTFVNPNAVRLQSGIVREVNQYKSYKEAKVYPVPLSAVNYDVKKGTCVLPLILPKGKYVFQSYFGYFKPNWIATVQANMWAGVVFDVNPGAVSYAGHITFNNEVKSQPPSAIKLDDNYDEDVGRAKNLFPILSGRKVSKALFYYQ